MGVKIWTNHLRMDATCKIAVSVPAYAEQECVLDCIWSVAQQQNIDPAYFEIGIIINNSWEEAKQRTPAFLNNQRSLQLLKACISKKSPAASLVRQHPLIKKIRFSGLRMLVVDASSLPYAAKRHSVGRVRDILARILINRFKQIGQTGGIILSTDADCRLDYLALHHAVAAFEQDPKVVGAVGTPWGFYPPDMLHTESIQVYFELRKYLQLLLLDLGIIQVIPVPKLFSQFKLEGFCACFLVDAYEAAGGFAHLQGGEDYVLGYRLAQIGKVMTIPSAVHVPLRISHRTSMGEGLGWEVERALQAVTSQRILLPSLDYYRAYSSLIHSLAHQQSWNRFSQDHIAVAQCINQRLYSQMQSRFLSKQHFLRYPEEYFKLKQYILHQIVPKIKKRFPDQACKQVLRASEELTFEKFSQVNGLREKFKLKLLRVQQDTYHQSVTLELIGALQKTKLLYELVEETKENYKKDT